MIYDLDQNPLSAAALSIRSGEQKIISVLIDAENDNLLRSETVAELLVEAKHNDQLSWTNLETDGLDLSAWSGSRATFQIRLTAGTITEIEERVFTLSVSL